MTRAARTTPRTGLFGIARTDTLRIQVSVPQTYLSLPCKPGQSADILVREFPGKRVSRHGVPERGRARREPTRTLLTEVRLPNPG